MLIAGQLIMGGMLRSMVVESAGDYPKPCPIRYYMPLYIDLPGVVL